MAGRNISLGKRNAAILNGEEDLTQWTDEELIRGQRRDKNGNWGGRPPKFIPAQVRREQNRRKITKGVDILSDSIVRAAEIFKEVMDDPEAENRDKLRAAEFVLKLVAGRADFEISVHAAEDPWLTVLRGSIVEVVAIDSDVHVLDVVSGEVGDG
jgi:hypothetical protein